MADTYEMQFDISTIKHLGLQMYSTLPPVMAELVSNAWDADAKRVDITVPKGVLNDKSQILVVDDGCGMSSDQIQNNYLLVGLDRRKSNNDAPTKSGRKVMGRKGIGKFSAFGIAGEIDVETVKKGNASRFKMNYAELEKNAVRRQIVIPALPPTGKVKKGTRIVLKEIAKFRGRRIDIANLRRGLARRFSVIGAKQKFKVFVNGKEITVEERDLTRLLGKGADGKPYLWRYNDAEIQPNTGWKVSGWIGALKRTEHIADGIQRGIVIMARGKLVQEPFVFDAVVGQQYALSYLVGELNAEFVDESEDTIGTTRNSLVWDAAPNAALKLWGQKEVNRIAREWAERRSDDNEKELAQNPVYQKFAKEAAKFENRQVKKVADALIRAVIRNDPIADPKLQEPVIQMCLDFMEFDAFQVLATELSQADLSDVGKIVELFREWEVVEAKEMMRVTDGRIKTIEKFEHLIDTNALEVPVLHGFLKEFPWVLDPRWQLIEDEVKFSELLRKEFPEDTKTPEEERRIDFLCVQESTNLIVVEIKRPKLKASMKQLEQIEKYVSFMREHVKKTTDEAFHQKEVIGYLLCGDLVGTGEVRQKKENLMRSSIYVRLYSDLLGMVQRSHKEFLKRYKALREAKSKN